MSTSASASTAAAAASTTVNPVDGSGPSLVSIATLLKWRNTTRQHALGWFQNKSSEGSKKIATRCSVPLKDGDVNVCDACGKNLGAIVASVLPLKQYCSACEEHIRDSDRRLERILDDEEDVEDADEGEDTKDKRSRSRSPKGMRVEESVQTRDRSRSPKPSKTSKSRKTTVSEDETFIELTKLRRKCDRIELIHGELEEQVRKTCRQLTGKKPMVRGDYLWEPLQDFTDDLEKKMQTRISSDHDMKARMNDMESCLGVGTALADVLVKYKGQLAKKHTFFDVLRLKHVAKIEKQVMSKDQFTEFEKELYFWSVVSQLKLKNVDFSIPAQQKIASLCHLSL